jgi:hypothetical protein
MLGAMRNRRLLLAVSALSTLTFCRKGNDAPVVPPPPDAEVLPLPGNPKGTLYDAGLAPPTLDAAAAPADAATAPKDAAAVPRDAAVRRPRPPRDGASLVANPKGSFYDKNIKDPGM